MPGFLLHLNATVTCAHAGTATPMTTVPTVLVKGQPVAVATSPYVVAGCTLPPPIAANGPCVTATWISASTAVSCYGNPVLLQDSQSICAPSGTPLLITMTQTSVFAR